MLFTWILLIACIISGAFWVYDFLIEKPKRKEKALVAVATIQDKQSEYASEKAFLAAKKSLIKQSMERPPVLEFTAGLFFVFLFVFCFRSFIIEPFRIPSDSMLPTLENGDFIAVNKWKYGLRFPIGGTLLIKGADVQRGDVIVFRYPMDKSLDYIKRVVAVPGDVLEYEDRRLTVNGQTYLQRIGTQKGTQSETWIEKTGETEHPVRFDLSREAIPAEYELRSKQHLKSCAYLPEDRPVRLRCKIPEGSYFVMGDNRDNSEDSRYWGFVPEENILGSVSVIWLNLSKPSRIGFFQ
jgi:signal peptidase I